MEMTGTETNNVDKSFVSYAWASLHYKAGPVPMLASFAANEVPVYFSDRHTAHNSPFDPSQTDRMNVEITQTIGLIDKSIVYRVQVQSLTWNTSGSFVPKIDESTGVIYGAMGTDFVTIALGRRGVVTTPK
jgi:hypothetical protein